MTRTWMDVKVVGIALLGLFSVGCNDPKPVVNDLPELVESRPIEKVEPKQGVASLDPAKVGFIAVKQYDTNGNRRIEDDELMASPALNSVLKLLDVNQDQALTDDEIAERVQVWKDTVLSSDVVVCPILLDGKPLAGATVTYIPELFLGQSYHKAKGLSDEEGLATIRVPGDTPLGIPFGFYRVEISKIVDSKETIPAKYNSATILGTEVYRENPKDLAQGFDAESFDLLAFKLFSSEEAERRVERGIMPKELPDSLMIDPVTTGKSAISRFDLDDDKKLSLAELELTPALKAAIVHLDVDNDGIFTADEIDFRREGWRSAEERLFAITCQVTLDDKPLEGATVYWIPVVHLGFESLVNEGIQDEKGMVAMGFTDAKGNAVLTLPTLKTTEPPLSGVPCGLYRIHISKRIDDQEIIPERYNSESILGQEVGPNVEGIRETVVFPLKSVEG